MCIPVCQVGEHGLAALPGEPELTARVAALNQDGSGSHRQPHRRETDRHVAAKARLRAQFRRQRRALTEEAQRRHAQAIAQHVLPRIGASDVVAVYMAQDGEVDLQGVIEGCWNRGIAVALPVLQGRTMFFAAHRQGAALRANRVGIREPASAEPLAPTVILAPLVAFDDKGHRLGMGGGFYDRYFAAHPEAHRFGIAHDCQRAASLPADEADIPLAAVATETGWHTFGAAPQS